MALPPELTARPMAVPPENTISLPPCEIVDSRWQCRR